MTPAEIRQHIIVLRDWAASSRTLQDRAQITIDQTQEILRGLESRVAILESRSEERSRRSSDMRATWVPLVSAILGAMAGGIVSYLIERARR